MLYLLLSVMSSATIALIMRFSSGKYRGSVNILAVNYLICSILSAVYTDFTAWTPETPGISFTVCLAILNGALYLAGFLLQQHSMSKNGIVLTSVFMRLGLLIPMVVSVLFFREMPTWLQFGGFCLAVCAIPLMQMTKDAGHRGIGVGLILLLVMSGCIDATAKVFEVLGNPALSGHFLLVTFLVAFGLCAALVLYKKEPVELPVVLFGTAIGIPNFFCSKFLLSALSQLPAVVVYPTFCVGTMLILTLCGILFFKERLSRRQWVAFILIVLALLILNL